MSFIFFFTFFLRKKMDMDRVSWLRWVSGKTEQTQLGEFRHYFKRATSP